MLNPLLKVPASSILFRRGLDIQERYRYGFYDSLIISAALEADCKRLFTEDMQDGQRIGTLVIENPFADH
ncbi:MAG: hypothetical protein U5K56_00525 [Halioglobus sp.]|nr:hypothetical protein [Halioglobus sp.]